MASHLRKESISQRILENLVYNNITTNNIEVVDGLSNDYTKIIIDVKQKTMILNDLQEQLKVFRPELIVKKLLIDHIRDVLPDDNFVTEGFNNENTT